MYLVGKNDVFDHKSLQENGFKYFSCVYNITITVNRLYDLSVKVCRRVNDKNENNSLLYTCKPVKS